MDKEELYYKLEDYLDGKLSETEQEALQKQIATDEEAAEQLALLRLERELANLMTDDKIDAKMQQWSKEKAVRRQSERNGQEISKRENGKGHVYWRSVVLGLLFFTLAVVGGYWLLLYSPPIQAPETINEQESEQSTSEGKALRPIEDEPPSRQEPAQINPAEKETPPSQKAPPIAEKQNTKRAAIQQLALAAAAATSPIGDMKFRGKNDQRNEEESILGKGYRLMGEGKLDEARQVLSEIPEAEKSLHQNAQQYIAYIHFEQKDYEATIPILENLIGIGYADKEKMKWLLALSYLAIGNETQGLELTKAIAESDRKSSFQKAAATLLQELD